MLDIGGVLRCRIYQHTPGFFQIYIPADLLGIEPGEVMISNDKFLESYCDHKPGERWYIRLYVNRVWKLGRNKRKYWKRLNQIPDDVLPKSEYYNEGVKIVEEELEREEWFEQDIKTSILLPIIKERSKIPNSLIYVDEYWKQ